VTVSQPAEDATGGVAPAGLIAARLDRFLWFAKPSSMTLLSRCSLAASPEALGGAITIALCGHWDHPPPCPLAPHYVASFPGGETVTLRVLFATDPANEQRVRSLIGEAMVLMEMRDEDRLNPVRLDIQLIEIPARNEDQRLRAGYRVNPLVRVVEVIDDNPPVLAEVQRAALAYAAAEDGYLDLIAIRC
jgi:hypothetical protein